MYLGAESGKTDIKTDLFGGGAGEFFFVSHLYVTHLMYFPSLTVFLKVVCFPSVFITCAHTVFLTCFSEDPLWTHLACI